MAVITVKISHLCIFNMLMFSVIASVIDLTPQTPLCGTMDGSPQKDSDKIYFKDRSQRIRTVEVNGTIYACYPDGTMVDTTSSSSSSSAENSNERITGYQLADRIHDDEKNLTVRDTRNRYIANVSKCAEQNQTYCTQNDNYPMDLIQKLLRKHLHKYADVFGSDVISTDIINRSGTYDEVTLCDSFEQVIYPTSGQNKNGDAVYIFNTMDHRQGVRVSMCQNTGQACRMAENFPNGYHTECKQHYVFRELLSLSPEGVPIKEKFKFAACCSCGVYRS